MISFRPQIVNLLKQILVVFALYTICRMLFFIFNHSQFNDITSGELLKLFVFGLRFDAFSVAATNALQRYNASKKTLDISERTYTLAQKRYDAGLLQTIDLITNQNNLFRARIQAIADQYDYVFRMKVLEFYKGQGLRL